MRAYAKASIAVFKVTRQTRTGFIIFLNSAPIFWFSKNQGSCERSTFGSEFLVMKKWCEYLRGLRYTLRIMGLLVKNPVLIYGDNQSLLCNTAVNDSTIKKNSSVVEYQFVREVVAGKEWITGYIKTSENCSDLITKTLSPGKDKKKNIRQHMYGIYSEDNVGSF